MHISVRRGLHHHLFWGVKPIEHFKMWLNQPQNMAASLDLQQSFHKHVTAEQMVELQQQVTSHLHISKHTHLFLSLYFTFQLLDVTKLHSSTLKKQPPPTYTHTFFCCVNKHLFYTVTCNIRSLGCRTKCFLFLGWSQPAGLITANPDLRP